MKRKISKLTRIAGLAVAISLAPTNQKTGEAYSLNPIKTTSYEITPAQENNFIQPKYFNKTLAQENIYSKLIKEQNERFENLYKSGAMKGNHPISRKMNDEYTKWQSYSQQEKIRYLKSKK